MIAPHSVPPIGDPGSGGGDWIIVSAAGKRLVLATDCIDAIVAPPPLAVVPHASAALLGAGNVGGRIMPIADLAGLLGHGRSGVPYDQGRVLRSRVGEGSLGIWVERADRLVGHNERDEVADTGGVERVDIAQLLAAGLVPRVSACGQPVPLAEVVDHAAAYLPAPTKAAFIVVETAGRQVGLRREAVLELIETLPWTAVPCAPAGFLGIGILRGAALPILSLAALLDRPRADVPGCFVAALLAGRRVLLAVDRVIGLRAVTEGGPVDPEALVSGELRHIVLGFPTHEAAGASRAPAKPDRAEPYLAFSVGGQDCAVPIAEVDRIVGPQALIALPRPAMCNGNRRHIAGAIELRGQIVPVASARIQLRCETKGETAAWTPGAYVVLRGPDGLGALGVDRIKQVMRLIPDEIKPAPADAASAIVAVALPPDGVLLRIIAPARLWDGA
jgi:chemotaxis signal transduction protein